MAALLLFYSNIWYRQTQCGKAGKKWVWANTFSRYECMFWPSITAVIGSYGYWRWMIIWHIHHGVLVLKAVSLQWNGVNAKALVFHLLTLKPRCYYSVVWTGVVNPSAFPSWKTGWVRCLQITRKSRIVKTMQASAKRTAADNRGNKKVNVLRSSAPETENQLTCSEHLWPT